MKIEKVAILLAGGLGTRLRPYTTVLPKPLMPIGVYTILEIVIRQLSQQGFTKLILAVNHQADLIKAFFGLGEKWGVEIFYSVETMPLGTMGPLKLINDLPENFIVMNGDILTDLKIDEFLNDHIKRRSIFSIASSRRVEMADYGVLEVDGNRNLKGFKEKPSFEFDVSMGIYAVSKKVLSHIPDSKAFGFDQLMLKLLDEKKAMPFVAHHSGYWLDIGRPSDYEKALEQFEEKKHILLPGL
jgi:NDP-sugar pyrophosphorylase family protein